MLNKSFPALSFRPRKTLSVAMLRRYLDGCKDGEGVREGEKEGV
jgi:hypothetical protein